MPDPLICPSCGKRYDVTVEYMTENAGCEVDCDCGQSIPIPSISAQREALYRGGRPLLPRLHPSLSAGRGATAAMSWSPAARACPTAAASATNRLWARLSRKHCDGFHRNTEQGSGDPAVD
jgi:hypothetical protein